MDQKSQNEWILDVGWRKFLSRYGRFRKNRLFLNSRTASSLTGFTKRGWERRRLCAGGYTTDKLFKKGENGGQIRPPSSEQTFGNICGTFFFLPLLRWWSRFPCDLSPKNGRNATICLPYILLRPQESVPFQYNRCIIHWTRLWNILFYSETLTRYRVISSRVILYICRLSIMLAKYSCSLL